MSNPPTDENPPNKNPATENVQYTEFQWNEQGRITKRQQNLMLYNLIYVLAGGLFFIVIAFVAMWKNLCFGIVMLFGIGFLGYAVLTYLPDLILLQPPIYMSGQIRKKIGRNGPYIQVSDKNLPCDKTIWEMLKDGAWYELYISSGSKTVLSFRYISSGKKQTSTP